MSEASTSQSTCRSAVMAIWKFTLDPYGTRVQMPKGARLLHVHEQAGDVCVWAEVDMTAPNVDRILIPVGTGHPIPRVALAYVGTAHLVEAGTPVVLHVYDGGEVDD